MIFMAELNYEEIQRNMKGVRLPSRRSLHSSSGWDDEQARIFSLRQKNVPELLKKLGIVFGKPLYLWPDGEYREEKPLKFRGRQIYKPLYLKKLTDEKKG